MDHPLVEIAREHEHRVLHGGWPAIPVERELARHIGVVAADGHEEHHEDRDEEDDHPRPVSELGGGDDRHHQSRGGRAHRVEPPAPLPSRPR